MKKKLTGKKTDSDQKYPLRLILPKGWICPKFSLVWHYFFDVAVPYVFNDYFHVRFHLRKLFTNLKFLEKSQHFFSAQSIKMLVAHTFEKNLRFEMSLSLIKNLFKGTVWWEELKLSEKSQIWKKSQRPEVQHISLKSVPSLLISTPVPSAPSEPVHLLIAYSCTFTVTK